MPRGYKIRQRDIDQTALYHFLWERTDENNEICIVQAKLAADLMVDPSAVNRAFREMTIRGWVTRVRREWGVVYRITDPAQSQPDYTDPNYVTTKSEPRQIKWG